MRFSPRHGLVLILLIIASVYISTVRNSFVNLDDPMLITENPHVVSASPANIGYVFTHFDPELYIPITLLTFQIESWSLGLTAWHFHLFSLLLHLIAVWLTYKIVKQYSRSEMTALLTALLFGVHPINAEAVLWISARKDILSAVLSLASLYYFFLYQKTTTVRWYWQSLAFFGLALLSKVTVVTLPILFILLAGTPKNIKTWLTTMGPFLILTLLFGSIVMMGKEIVEQPFHLTDFVFMAFRSTLFYLTLIVIPTGQAAVHVMNPHDVYSPLLPLAIGLVCFISWIMWSFRKRLPLVFGGWLFFLVTLAPTFLHYTRGNENFMLGSERYMYLPSIGIFLIVASLWTELWNVRWITKPTKVFLALTSAIFVLVLGYLTVLRTFVFEDAIIFNIDALQKNPYDGRTWYNLGKALESEKRPMEAEEAYVKALETKPTLADAAINLGILFLREGRTDEGIDMLRKATVIQPDYFKGYFNLGVAYQDTGRFLEAETAYRKSIELFPEFTLAHRNVAGVLGAQKKFAEAMMEYEILTSLDPGFKTELERLKATKP